MKFNRHPPVSVRQQQVWSLVDCWQIDLQFHVPPLLLVPLKKLPLTKEVLGRLALAKLAFAPRPVGKVGDLMTAPPEDHRFTASRAGIPIFIADIFGQNQLPLFHRDQHFTHPLLCIYGRKVKKHETNHLVLGFN